MVTKIPVQACRAVYVENAVAFIGTDSRFIIMELSNPLQPQTIGSCSIPSSAIEVIIKDTLAFILSSENGLRIISISDYQNPQEINHFSAGQDTALFLDIFIQDSLAYIADSEYGVRVINIHDIHNINQITLINNSSFPAHGSYIHPTSLCANGNYCFVGIYYWDEDPFADLFLVDLTDPLNPTITYCCGIGEEIEYMTIAKDYLYLLDYAWGFYIFDVSSPLGIPVLQSNILTYSTWHGGLWIRENYAYISPGIIGERLIVIDISDKSNPQQVGYFGGDGTKGSIFVDHQYIYWCGPDDSLYVLKFNKPVEINETDENRYSLRYLLNQNYPNPFNSSTTIHYMLSKPEYVRLSVYDELGRLVRKLVDQNKALGKHSVIWDGKNDYDILVSSGTYFYCLTIGKNIIDSKKMIMIR